MYTIASRTETVSSTFPMFCIIWTDNDNNTSQNWSSGSSPSNTLTTYRSTTVDFFVTGGTAVKFATGANCPGRMTYATNGAASMQYAIHLKVEAVQ